MTKSNTMAAIKSQVHELLQHKTVYDLATLTGHSYSTTWRQVVGKTSLKMDFIIALEEAGLLDFSGLNVVYKNKVDFSPEEIAQIRKGMNVLENIGCKGLEQIRSKIDILAEVERELY